MYRKLLCGALGLAVIGVVGYIGYTMYYKDNDADSDGSDDYWAGLNFGVTGWKPELPIHPKAKQPTEGVYTPFKFVGTSRGSMGKMMPARSEDYWNPAQLVPTTGPGNLAPLVGINTGFVNADTSEFMNSDNPVGISFANFNLPIAYTRSPSGGMPNLNPSQSVITQG